MSRSATVITLALLGGLLTFSRFASVRQKEAADTGRLAHLRTMSPLRLVARNKDDQVIYTFADPERCRCLYVGGAKE